MYINKLCIKTDFKSDQCFPGREVLKPEILKLKSPYLEFYVSS